LTPTVTPQADPIYVIYAASSTTASNSVGDLASFTATSANGPLFRKYTSGTAATISFEDFIKGRLTTANGGTLAGSSNDRVGIHTENICSSNYLALGNAAKNWALTYVAGAGQASTGSSIKCLIAFPSPSGSPTPDNYIETGETDPANNQIGIKIFTTYNNSGTAVPVTLNGKSYKLLSFDAATAYPAGTIQDFTIYSCVT
jgi:hypothetical protein